MKDYEEVKFDVPFILSLLKDFNYYYDEKSLQTEVHGYQCIFDGDLTVPRMVLGFLLIDAFLKGTGGFFTLEQLYGHDEAVTSLSHWDCEIEEEYVRHFGENLGTALASYGLVRTKMNLSLRGLLSPSPMRFEVPELKISKEILAELRDYELFYARAEYQETVSRAPRRNSAAIKIIFYLFKNIKVSLKGESRAKGYFLVMALESALLDFSGHGKRLLSANN